MDTHHICCICLDIIDTSNFANIMGCCNQKIHSKCLLEYHIYNKYKIDPNVFNNKIDYDNCPLCRRTVIFFNLSQLITVYVLYRNYTYYKFDHVFNRYLKLPKYHNHVNDYKSIYEKMMQEDIQHV